MWRWLREPQESLPQTTTVSIDGETKYIALQNYNVSFCFQFSSLVVPVFASLLFEIDQLVFLVVSWKKKKWFKEAIRFRVTPVIPLPIMP